VIRDAFKDHWGHVETPFEEDYEEWVHWMEDDPSFDQSLWFVAVEGDKIVGCSICYDVTARGRTWARSRPWACGVRGDGGESRSLYCSTALVSFTGEAGPR
jgi:hypothetical protein